MNRICPQCHLFMEQTQWHDLDIAVCGNCGGVWVPGGVWTSQSEEIKLGATELVSLKPSVIRQEPFVGQTRPCPDCRFVNLTLEEDPAPTTSSFWICSKCDGRMLITFTGLSDVPPEAGEIQQVVQEPLPDAAEPLQNVSEPVGTGAAAEAAEVETQAPSTVAVALESVRSSVSPDQFIRPISPESALDTLVEGNRRFVVGNLQYTDASQIMRSKLVDGQEPFAVVVGCSDSRVPPEIVFDQGLGRVFVVRTAGGTFGPMAMEGIIFAIERFHVPIVVVLGHQGCSAVGAAVDQSAQGNYMREVAMQIKPAVDKARTQKGDVYENAVRENANRIAQNIANHEHLAPLVKSRKLAVVPMVYRLDSGEVKLYPQVTVDDSRRTNRASHVSGNTTDVKDGNFEAEPMIGATKIVANGNSAPPIVAIAAENAVCYCIKCHHSFGRFLAVCPNCKSSIVPPEFPIRCPACAAMNPIRAAVCAKCGKPVGPARVHEPGISQGGNYPQIVKPFGKGGAGCSTSILIFFLPLGLILHAALGWIVR